MLSTIPSHWTIHFLSQLPGFQLCFTSTSTFLQSLFFLRQRRIVQLLWMNFLSLSFFYEWEALAHFPLSLYDGARRWMCEWSRAEIDRRPLRHSYPSLIHKLPSNHRQAGWLMLYTHTHTHLQLYTEAEPIECQSASSLSSDITCTSEMLLKCIMNTLLDWLTPLKCFHLISGKGDFICCIAEIVQTDPIYAMIHIP